jgi:putative SOS response-associated peptidase YedK
MCSRYSLTSPAEAVRSYFSAVVDHDFPPRYNIAPTQPVAIIRKSETQVTELALVRWGLIPSWVKDPKAFSTMINARAETAVEKPSFRAAMRHRRCLVPTDGFYEWTGAKGDKRPHLVTQSSGGLMAMAGLWEHWLSADGSELQTMAILTVAANASMQPLHDRMPLILPSEMFEPWLDCRSGSVGGIEALLNPSVGPDLTSTPVSRRLNNPRNEGPEVQTPAGGAAEPG